MTKVYTANTPLILEDAQGRQFRVEPGEKVELAPEQYESVAAHVTPAATTAKEPEQQAEAPEQTPPEADPAAEPESKTKTQRKTKADA